MIISKQNFLEQAAALMACAALMFACSSTPETPSNPTPSPASLPTTTIVKAQADPPTLTANDGESSQPVKEVVIEPTPTEKVVAVNNPTPTAVPSQPVFGFTNQRPDGNRLVAGYGALPDVTPLDIPLESTPQWVVAAPLGEAILWVAVLDDGRVQAFKVTNGTFESASITPDKLPPGMPPLLKVENGVASLVVPPEGSDASPLTHPVMLSLGQMAFVENNGDLVIWNNSEVARLPVNALPDARLLVDESSRILLLIDKTTEYGHGALGDKLEAGSISLIETSPTPRVTLTIPIPDGGVVEGVAPIWTDITGDSEREIIVTISNPDTGAQVLVFDESGQQIAKGPPVGQGFRWRHQLVVAPFGPAGQPELAEVITPHLGSTTQFFSLEGETLQLMATINGYTSHIIGTRNLDMAVAGDYNGDGETELILALVRTQTELGGIQRTPEGAEVVWSLPVGGQMVTNLAAVTLPNGALALGAGHNGQVLRIWQQ